MKKILLSVGLFSLVIVGRSQTVLNEIYTDPGNGKSEFFELYNSSTIPGGQNVDCFTILTYVNQGSNEGWYVMDLPNLSVGPKSYFVGAAASPFSVQSLSNVTPDFNWNNANFRNGSTGGSLIFAKLNAARTAFTTTAVANPLDDFLAGGNGKDYIVLVFVNGIFNNGFIGGQNSGSIPSYVANMPDLTVAMNTTFHACSNNFNIHFATLGALENVGSQPGSDNGYARTSDGKCGAWEKTSSSVHHTPGTTNGGAAGLTGSLTTAQTLTCNTGPGVSTVTYNITGVSGSANEADDFPVDIQLYYDFGTVGQLDGADLFVSQQSDALIADPAKTFTIPQTQPVILVYKTKRGCFDKVVALSNGCLPLPVAFKSFSAIRVHANVNVKFETAWEQNSAGFAIERNTNGSWSQVGYLNSMAVNGNSSDLLTYTFTDPNNAKGISQYRIRQVDLDNKAKYSEVRTVRGEEQLGQVIVYPNPSIDGTVNVSFEDATPKDVTVSDMSGRIVKQMKGVTSNNITITNLTPGMYTLRAVDPATGAQNVAKIVVNKR